MFKAVHGIFSLIKGLMGACWGAVQVVGVTDDLVAVSKPATWPVHATGQHRKNTVAGVLEATRPDLGPLHPVHRLDKPVSGLLLFARHPAAADNLRELIQVRTQQALKCGLSVAFVS